MYNPYSLEGKVILVTGASSGIGRATAIECARMGASVVICGRDESRLNETFAQLEGSGHLIFSGDLSNHETIAELVDSVSFIDGAVLAAGKCLMKPILFSDRKAYDDLFNLNFFSQVETMRLLMKKKKVREKGSFVFLLSVGGTSNFGPGLSMYGSAKAALQAVVRYGAIEFGSKKIRVNGICPGMVETPMIYNGAVADEQMDQDRKLYPLGRYGQPSDIALGAVFLLSNASSWISGHSLVIDGGLTTT